MLGFGFVSFFGGFFFPLVGSFFGGVVQCFWAKYYFFSQDLIFAVSEAVLSGGEHIFTGNES